MIEHRRIGSSNIEVPAQGVGTLAWGDKRFGLGKKFTHDDLFEAYKACLDNGINYFDTSENYGPGLAEQTLGDFRKADGRPIIVSTKLSPANIFEPSNRFWARTVMPTLEGSLRRLGMEAVDMYMLHSPPPQRKMDSFLDALGETYKSGKAKTVGVSNFTVEQMRYAHQYLAKQGVPLTFNETGYNLLYRFPETNGMFEALEELDMSLIAIVPLSEGILTGKYRVGGQATPFVNKVLFKITQLHDENRKRTGGSLLHKLFTTPYELQRERLEPLFVVLDAIASEHSKTIAQVALNWLFCSNKRVVAVPGCKNAKQAISNAGAISWKLAKDEIRRINDAQAATLH